MNRAKIVIILMINLISLSCRSEEDDIYYQFGNLDSLIKIWDSDKYCAFTDLAEYNNILYCCFRESDGHYPSSSSNYGKIRILKSYDGQNWVSAALIEDPNFDLRDPKLEVTSDNRLMLLVGCSSFDTLGKFGFRKSKVGFSQKDLSQLSELKDLQLGLNNQFSHLWLWRSVWHNDYAYGVAYLRNNKPVLFKSKDGLKYEKVVEFALPTSCSESGISFRSNGNMIIVIRDDYGNGYIAESTSPYEDWDWKPLQERIESPILLNVDDYIFLAMRNASKKTVSLEYMYPSSLRLKNMDNQSLHGDMGYPGLIINGSDVILSYYNNGQIFIAKYSKSTIFDKINE